MALCEFRDKCRLHAQLPGTAPELAREYEERYCNTQAEKCALHMVASVFGLEKVPLDLLPGQSARAMEAIEGIRKWAAD